MASFGTEDQCDDDFLDQQQPGQGDGGGFMSDDDGSPDQQQPDDDSMSDDDGDFHDHHQHLDQGDPFTAALTAAIRSYTHAGFHGPDGSYSEHYYAFEVGLDLAGGGDHFAVDEEDEDEEGDAYEDDSYSYGHYYRFPMLPAAASEAAIAALEAAEAPADDCCAVCLLQAGFDDDGGAWSRLEPCGHRFHAACVGEWLRVKLSCPVCRRPAAAGPPLPDIVNEMLAMSFDESVVFENSARWLAFLADPDGFSTTAGNSSS